MSSGTLPHDWTDANICSIFKKGKRTAPNNYRPVSLTSQVVKVLERLVLNRILEFSDQHKLLSCEQHGFKSSMTGQMDLTHLLKQGIDIIYTDFKKVFDSVPHNRLVNKLSKHGITNQLLRWMTAFLKPQSDKRLRLPTTCDYLRPTMIVGSRSYFYHNRTSSHTLRSLYDRSSMIVAFWSLNRMQVADCCTTIV